ncbi:hypothetical protein CRUP_031705, partial [Coryphaenoides rupestris]
MMLALSFSFTCLLLLSEPVHSNRSARAQCFNMQLRPAPRAHCTDPSQTKCQLTRLQALEASVHSSAGGHLSPSAAIFVPECSAEGHFLPRAQCFNMQLRPAPRAHCTDPSQTKCQLTRLQALEASVHSSAGGHLSPSAAIFVPECSAEGHFLPVQCHNQTGYCWCSTHDGRPIGGTSVLLQTPNCTEPSGPRPTPKPGRPGAELTAPPLWVTIQLNSDLKGNRSARRPSDSPQTCERERSSLLSAAQLRSVWQGDRFIPECTADGRYHPVQCHVATGYCWCVRLDTGRPIPGTSTRNQLPECTATEEAKTDRKFKDRPLPGCPGARKREFLQSLVRALQLEALHAGKLTPHRPFISAPTDSSSSSVTPQPPSSNSSSATSSSLTSSLTSSPSSSPGPPALAESSGPEGALRWHFERLDVDASGSLGEREARPLRQFLRRRLKPRRCAKKFAQYCDRDQDRGLTLHELAACLQ